MIAFRLAAFSCIASALAAWGEVGDVRHAYVISTIAFALVTVATIADERG